MSSGGGEGHRDQQRAHERPDGRGQPAEHEPGQRDLRELTDEATAQRLLALPSVSEFLGRDHQLREVEAFAKALERYADGEVDETKVGNFSLMILENQVQEWFEEDEELAPCGTRRSCRPRGVRRRPVRPDRGGQRCAVRLPQAPRTPRGVLGCPSSALTSANVATRPRQPRTSGGAHRVGAGPQPRRSFRDERVSPGCCARCGPATPRPGPRWSAGSATRR